MQTSLRYVVMLACVLLVGCLQGQLVGSVGGSSVVITRFDTGEQVDMGTAWDEAYWLELQGETLWQSHAPLVKLLAIGVHQTALTAPDSTAWYLVTYSGGTERDADDDLVWDDAGTPVAGSWRALVPGSRIDDPRAIVSPLTEALVRRVELELENDDNAGIRALLDEVSADLLADINDDGVVDYDDALSFNRLVHAGQYLGEAADLVALGSAIAAGASSATLASLAADISGATLPGIDTGTYPEQLPAFAAVGLYADASPFNQRIGSDPAIDPDSDLLVQSLVAAEDFVIQVRQYSAPVYFAGEATPRYDVDLACGPWWEMGVSRLLDVPVPEWATPADDVDGAANPPVGCGEDSDQDNHMVILDVANRCEYNFWQARQVGDDWQASWGAAISMDSEGVFPGALSTRGSGFTFLGGVIWPDELAAGQINHPLAFSYPFTKTGGPVAPATDSDGVTSGATALPMGARVQLDPDFDLDSLSLEPWERTIARALQEYGMLLVDTGGSSGIGFYAVDPRSARGDIYDGLLPDADFVLLDNLVLSELPLRVLALGDQDGNFSDNFDLPDNACAVFD